MITFNSTIVPKLGPTLSHKNQTVGSYFQLFCTVQEGSLPLFFDWSKNGQSIKTNHDVNYKIDNYERSSTLTIAKIDRKDAGNYTCIVRNAFGTDSQNVLLTVKGMNNFIKHLISTIRSFIQFLPYGKESLMIFEQKMAKTLDLNALLTVYLNLK
jgi:hypothetical protein